MSIDGLRHALEALEEPGSCEGTVAVRERVAIVLPDGDLGAVGDPRFVDWLIEHGEPAPFGQAGETRLDPTVRRAWRLAARGAAQVGGFDPAQVLEVIERTLSPRRRLVARLTDVIVYPPGGHFAPHKDTPRSADLVGTLIVGLPIEHAGGAFVIDDPGGLRTVDWSGPVDPTALRWVALFSDLDHEIRPVTAGARVTLVYAIHHTDAIRADAGWDARLAAVRTAAHKLELPEFGPLMIACTRHVIAPDGPQPQEPATLRGSDRDVADILTSCGFTVRVRTCLAARDLDYEPAPRQRRLRGDAEVVFARLAQPFPDGEAEKLLDCLVFDAPVWGDGGGYDESEASSLEAYVLDTVPIGNWIIRRNAAATFLRAIDFAADGFVGNAASESYLYKLAALEVTR